MKYQQHEVIERNRQEFTGKLDNSAIAHYDADLENSQLAHVTKQLIERNNYIVKT